MSLSAWQWADAATRLELLASLNPLVREWATPLVPAMRDIARQAGNAPTIPPPDGPNQLLVWDEGKYTWKNFPHLRCPFCNRLGVDSLESQVIDLRHRNAELSEQVDTLRTKRSWERYFYAEADGLRNVTRIPGTDWEVIVRKAAKP